MKTTKRLLALVLALCMVLSVMPTAFAAEGTSDDPISIDHSGQTVTVAAGATVYYGYRDMMSTPPYVMTVTGTTGFTVTQNSVDYVDVDGTVSQTVYGNMMGAVMFSITNSTDAEQSYTVTFVQPAGSSSNPHVLEEVGTEVTAVTDGSYNGVWYSWTATESGTFTLTMSQAEGWTYVIDGNDQHWYDDSTVVSSDSIDLVASETVKFMVNTYSATTYDNPVGEVKFTTSFEAGEVESNYGTSDNPIPITADESAQTVGAGETLYFYYNKPGSYGPYEMTVTGTTGFTVTQNSMPYTDVEGTVSATVYGNMMGNVMFSITNSTDSEQSYIIKFAEPTGTYSNPNALEEVGTEVTAVTDGSYNGVWYSWTAAEAGTFTLTMNQTEGWTYVIDGNNQHWYDDATVVSSESVEVVADQTVKFMVNTYNAMTGMNPAGEVKFTASFTAGSTEQPGTEVEEGSYSISETVLVLGENNLTMDTTVENTLFAFEPTEVGEYTFTAEDADAKVGFWGTEFYQYDSTGDAKTNTLSYTVSSVGPTIMIGVAGVESVTLTITKLEYVAPTNTTVVYENEVEPTEYTLGEYDILTAVDPAEAEAVKDENGVYHLNSVDGPELVLDLTSSQLNLTEAQGLGRLIVSEQDEDGNTTTNDYNEAMGEFIVCAAAYNDVNNVYPLTDDLVTMLDALAAGNDWYSWLGAENWLGLCMTVQAPVTVGAGEFPVTTASIAAGEGVWYEVYGSNGSILTISDADASITIGEETYKAENGVVSVEMVSESPRTPIMMYVANNGTAAETYKMELSYPVGSMSNPAELKIGENSAQIEAGNAEGYWYTYTAAEDGQLIVTMDNADKWTYVVNNETASAYGDIRTSEDKPAVKATIISVKKGDVVKVMVNTYDDGSVIAGTVKIIASNTCPTAKFTDVVNPSWYHDDMDWMVANGFMNGTDDTTMEPDAQLTRAQLVQMLYNIAGKPSVEGLTENFDDVNEDHWFYKAIVWACNLETPIVNGTSATTFEPDANITREQVAAIMYRYAGAPEVEGDLTAFADAERVNDYAVDALVWATQNGIINGIAKGDVTNLAPRPVNENDKNDTEGLATRAQAAVILSRYLQK